MGKKGGSRHLKRKPAPEFWPIHRKEAVWTVKSKPGPHPLNRSFPLNVVIRDILGFAKTRKEAAIIISGGKVLVDGKARKEAAFPVGLMDVVTIPEAKKNFRVLIHRKGLLMHPIAKDETKFKLCRIENKTVTKQGHIQLNLHDGGNRTVQVSDPKNPEEDLYQSFNVVKTTIPGGEITEQVQLKKDNIALITGGKNRGTYGKIVDIEEAEGKKKRLLLTTVEDSKGRQFQTILDYIFVVGTDNQLISLPEVE